MKRLQRYYFHVGLPVLLVILGTVMFFGPIMGTVEGNPHPQINYAIFFLIAVGCVQSLLHVHRINREGKLLVKFQETLTVFKNPKLAREMLEEEKQRGRNDVVDVLELVMDTHGKHIDALHHAAIESEIAHFQARQNRKLLLAGFMSGMMVGLGLLGTFIGLLGALNEIGKLIGSFNIGDGAADPIAAVSGLVERLTAPMQAMGIAFSASLFGVLGSLIMSMMMVFIKSATVELATLVQTKVSWMVDLKPADTGAGATVGIDDGAKIASSLQSLAEHSPIIHGLLVSLDQSERRVKQVLAAMSEMHAQLGASAQAHVQCSAQTLQAVEQVSKQVGAIERGVASLTPNFEALEKAARSNVESTQNLARALSHESVTHAEHWKDVRNMLAARVEQIDEAMFTVQRLLERSVAQSAEDSQSRTAVSQSIKALVGELSDRQEQIAHHLLKAPTQSA